MAVAVGLLLLLFVVIVPLLLDSLMMPGGE